jgi:soluble lytic murein transglycosylase-like protein
VNPLLIAVPLVLAAVALSGGRAHASVGSGIDKKKSIRDVDWSNDIDPDTSYPQAARELASKWSEIFDVPSSWIVSQAYVESKFMPLAQNPSGATGILQLKLPTATDVVRWILRSKYRSNPKVVEVLRDWHGNRQDLLNMELNLMLAAFYMRYLRGKFGNDHRLVAAAYNQGEGAVKRALDSNSPLPPRGLEYVARVEDAKQHGYA